MRGYAAAALAALLFTGCASVTQGNTHVLRIETETAKGDVIEGADCRLTNDHGTVLATSGTSTPVRRSAKDLEISCSSAGLPDAEARLVSRANAGLAGNILIGGAIGAMVDHNTGSAYTYPTWVRLVFGEYVTLDRKDEREGVAMAASAGSATGLTSVMSVSTPTPARATPAAATAAAPAAATPAVAPAPMAAATPAAGSATAAPAPVATGPARGQVLDYRVTDRSSNRTTTVKLRVDGIDGDEVAFNNGTRLESRRTGTPTQGAGLLGELDNVTPPAGWFSGGRVLRGMWPVKFSRNTDNARLSYDLMARAGGEQTIRSRNGEFRAVRIDLEGWLERGGTLQINPARAPYRATVWVSPTLQRAIRFEATSRSSTNVGGAYFQIDEMVELVGVVDPQQ